LCSEGKQPIVLHDVLVVNGLRQCLLSTKKIKQTGGAIVMQGDQEIVFVAQGKNIKAKLLPLNIEAISIEVESRLTQLQLSGSKMECLYSTEESADVMQWHKRLGHVGNTQLRLIFNNVTNLKSLYIPSDFLCPDCQIGKFTRTFPHSTTHSYKVGELIHIDLMGPFDPPSIGKKSYILNMVEEVSKVLDISLLEAKRAELVVPEIIRFIEYVQSRTKTKVLLIRSDRGKEFDNATLEEYTKKNGIVVQFTSGYSPHENGTAERWNRTILDKLRTIQECSKLPDCFWGEVVNSIVIMHNVLPYHKKSGKSPLEVLCAKVSHFTTECHHFHPLGTELYVANNHRNRKLDTPGCKGYLVGYEPRSLAYRWWNGDLRTKQVHVATHAKFNYKKAYRDLAWSRTATAGLSFPNIDKHAHIEKILQERCTRQGRMLLVKWLHTDDPKDATWESELALQNTEALELWDSREHVNVSLEADENTRDPKSVREALQGPDGEQWCAAMKLELQNLADANTWDIVPRPDNANV
jgi:GAG-pre-integrase domain/Integrase core domain